MTLEEVQIMDERIKRIRAEVLAGVKAYLAPLREKLDLLLCDEDLTDEKLREASEGLLPVLADSIRFLHTKLQPAAKDLEGLLREAELKGVKFSQCATISATSARISELEKARAVVGKG